MKGIHGCAFVGAFAHARAPVTHGFMNGSLSSSSLRTRWMVHRKRLVTPCFRYTKLRRSDEGKTSVTRWRAPLEILPSWLAQACSLAYVNLRTLRVYVHYRCFLINSTSNDVIGLFSLSLVLRNSFVISWFLSAQHRKVDRSELWRGRCCCADQSITSEL